MCNDTLLSLCNYCCYHLSYLLCAPLIRKKNREGYGDDDSNTVKEVRDEATGDVTRKDNKIKIRCKENGRFYARIRQQVLINKNGIREDR